MKRMKKQAKISEKEHRQNDRQRTLYTKLTLQGNAESKKHEQFNLDSEQESSVPQPRRDLAQIINWNPTLKIQIRVQDQAQAREVRAVCPHLPILQLMLVLIVTIQNE